MAPSKWTTRGEVVAALVGWLDARPRWSDAEQRAFAVAVEIGSRDELATLRERFASRASMEVAARLRLACAMRDVPLSDEELRAEVGAAARDLDRGLSADARRWDGVAGRAAVHLLSRLGPASIREVLSSELGGREASFYRSLYLSQQAHRADATDLGDALRTLADMDDEPPASRPERSTAAATKKEKEITGERAVLRDAMRRAERGDSSGIETLIALMKSDRRHIRNGALLCLVRLRAGHEVFRSFVRHSSDYHELRLSLHGLARSRDPADHDLLLECLLTHPDGMTHLACLGVLAGVYALDPDAYVDTIDDTYRGDAELQD